MYVCIYIYNKRNTKKYMYIQKKYMYIYIYIIALLLSGSLRPLSY
jgi:hypothetical protein